MSRPNLPSSTVASFLPRALRTPIRPLPRTRPSHFTCAFAARNDRSRNFSSTRPWGSFKLVHFAHASNPFIGGHKILDWNVLKLPLPSESEHKITVCNWPAGPEIEGSDEEVGRATVKLSLEEAIQNGIKPHWFLVPNESIPKKIAEDFESLSKPGNMAKFSGYTLVQTRGNVQVGVKATKSLSVKVKYLASLKVLNFELGAPSQFYRLQMEKAIAFLENGNPVEFNMRAKQKAGGSPDLLPWVLNHFPHLRPDFILESMPEGSYYIVDPFVKGGLVKWALGMLKPTESTCTRRPAPLTKRILSRKQEIEAAVQHGKVSQLPKRMREELIKEGHEGYSLDTGVPKAMAQPQRRMAPRWGAESLVPSPERKRELLKHKKLTRAQRDLEKIKDQKWRQKLADPDARRAKDTVGLDDPFR